MSVFYLLIDIYSSFVVLFVILVSEMVVFMICMFELSMSDDVEVEVLILVYYLSGRKLCKMCIKLLWCFVFLCVLIVIFVVVVGVLIGYFVYLVLKLLCIKMLFVSEDVYKKFVDEVSIKELENNLR